MAEKNPILFTFIGNRDPYVENSEDFGPVLSLLEYRTFSRVFLFCTGSDYFERARTVEEICGTFCEGVKFSHVSLELNSVIDYEEIFSKMKISLNNIMEKIKSLNPDISVLLDPGTPQMQTIWFLLAKSGLLHARLLQGIPPRFGGGSYRLKEVNLESSILPEIIIPEGIEKEQKWFTPVTANGIIGESAVFKKVLERAFQFASYDISVCIRGDTGTGKNLLAKFIHDNSERKGKPFQPINCSAITSTLVESEFFGHIKGAFTGAEKDRLGKFRAADTGTIFLDEIGDLPLNMQPKLLKVLEEKKLQPVGSDEEIEVDVRVIAATNKNLEEMIEKKEFRRDLFERLNQVSITIPHLQERKEDIPLLVRTFIDKWNKDYSEEKGLSEETMKYLMEYPWPGNVRELKNTVSGLCATGMSLSIGPDLLPGPILEYFHKKRSVANMDVQIPENGIDLRALLFQMEKDFYLEALKSAEGNKERAAKLLGINPPAFRKALRERFCIQEQDDDS